MILNIQGIKTLFQLFLYPFFTHLIYQKGDKDIKEYSELFNNVYEIEDTVRIVNTKQAGLYIKNNVTLVDLFWSKNSLVFVFDKQSSKIAYDLWCNHKLF